jgi:hypothetical protein
MPDEHRNTRLFYHVAPQGAVKLPLSARYFAAIASSIAASSESIEAVSPAW